MTILMIPLNRKVNEWEKEKIGSKIKRPDDRTFKPANARLEQFVGVAHVEQNR